ncbi:MAG: substrate-binding domain-containing protein [Thermoflexales bacterium]|nr:substrate-binding domain-containing protein [Thermoflexales bacterium]
MRSLQAKRPTIGMLVGWPVYWSAPPTNLITPLLRGVQAAARQRDCNLLLACGLIAHSGPRSPHPRPAWPVAADDSDVVPVGAWNTDGLITINPLLSQAQERYIQTLVEAGHPLVFIHSGQAGPTVRCHDEDGIRQAVEHLAWHGHRRIAFIAGKPEETANGPSQRRLCAYQATMQAAGLEVDPALVAYGHHLFEGGQAAVRQLLSDGLSFTAIVASNDASAAGAAQALTEAGRHIPGDVAVIGFDDQTWATAHDPPLTTIHAPLFEAGYQALELLIEYVEGRQPEITQVELPVRLVIRQSCGCPANAALPAPDDTAQGHALDQTRTVSTQLVQTLAASVSVGVESMSQADLYLVCQQLAEAFVASLRQGTPQAFQLALNELLDHLEASGEDAHVWQMALMTLRDYAEALGEDSPALDQQLEAMLRWGQLAITTMGQWQHKRYIFERDWKADRIALLTSRLLTALDESQVFDILAQVLPQLDIRHAGVAFFEPEGNDATAWSVLRQVPTQQEIRFPTRHFPPAGLYPAQEALHLALLPLVVDDVQLGFVALDAGDLGLNAAIVRHTAVALRAARLHKQATQARQQAEEANQLKSRFLSMVSHELRTPLSLVVTLSDILLQEEAEGELSLPEPYRQDIQQIHANAQHLDGLIQDVLDLAQSEMGQLKLVCEPVDLARALQVVAGAGAQMARNKGLDWRLEIPASPPQVWGDKTRLQQAVLNLVSNAAKFTRQGSIALRVEVEDKAVRVSISDTGLGVAPEEQELIFDEFRQSERTTSLGYGGIGLGLPVCKRLVEMHGGEIGVHSSGEEGSGSTFYFTLPVMTSVVPLSKAEALLAEYEYVVMLVAGPVGDYEHLHRHLMDRGFRVKILEIDRDANWLGRLAASPASAILLDQVSASRRGGEALRLLKRNPATRHIPILFYALAYEEDAGALLEVDYLTKPVATAELSQALKRHGVSAQAAQEARTILVVDDDPPVLDMFVRIVHKHAASHRVLTASNGVEALDLIRRELPDLVLLDLRLPQMNGFQVLETMRTEELSRDIPVIVLSAEVLAEADMARLNQGVTAVLRKGLFSVSETLKRIEEALARQQKIGSETQRVVRKAMAYIHEHYAEEISREEIARHIGVSEGYLSGCFRDEAGVSLVVYLNRYRVNQAKRLLQSGAESITNIATSVGFSDSSYFSRVFRREVGVSPLAYRQGQRQD